MKKYYGIILEQRCVQSCDQPYRQGGTALAQPAQRGAHLFIHTFFLSVFLFLNLLSLPVGFVFLFLLYFSSLCLLEKGGGTRMKKGDLVIPGGLQQASKYAVCLSKLVPYWSSFSGEVTTTSVAALLIIIIIIVTLYCQPVWGVDLLVSL